MDALLDLDCLGMAELVRRREVQPIELVDAAIARLEQVNPQINAVITPMFDQAREAAARDASSAGPFAGVPYLLKDVLGACKGVRFTQGSRLLRDFVAREDSFLVQRLRRAGFLFIGKTNAPEFGLLPTTEPALFGPSKNPWNPEHITGGSSGGSAAAVAAGVVPAAHANDGGGSIRIPASCCGVFGLKPTRGRITLGPALGDIVGGLVAEHCVSRTVRDSAAILDATQGPAVGDPYYPPAPARPYLDEVATPPGALRIGVLIDSPMGGSPHADCVTAVREASRLCEDLGHRVEELRPEPIPPMVVDLFMVLWSAGAAANVDGSSLMLGRSPAPDELEPSTVALAEQGRSHSAATYLMAKTYLQGLVRAQAEALDAYDAILSPTLGEPPPLLGTFAATDENPLAPFERTRSFTPYAAFANLSGQPAMSVPLHWNQAGLPIGVQFVGRYGDEATLFRLAGQLEEARPWATRKPGIWAGPV